MKPVVPSSALNSFATDEPEEIPQRSPRRARWRSPLLWVVLGAFSFLVLSGFALFFAKPWISASSLLGNMHTILGVLTLLPYGFYQLAHVRRVTNLRSQLHYKLGLLTMWSFVISGLSGGWLVAPTSAAVELTHLMSSFAFLVLLTAHLIVVARLLFVSGAGNR